jgi:hypothetical protein
MARGWESKAIEDQQQALENGRRPGTTAAAASGAVPTPERAALLLARTRALGDLQLACAPAHRAMLEQAIRDLDARLAVLD